MAIVFPNSTAGFSSYFDGQTPHIIYLGIDNHIHNVWKITDWYDFDMTATVGAELAAGHPMAYVGDGVQRIVYRGTDNHIHELWLRDNKWNHFNMTDSLGAELAAGDPMGYVGDGMIRVVYRGIDNHIHELSLEAPWFGRKHWKHFNMTDSLGVELAVGDPMGYVGDNMARVVYRGTDKHIHELWLETHSFGQKHWKHFNMTESLEAPLAAGDPWGWNIGWGLSSNLTPRVVYRGFDNNLYELWFEYKKWFHENLTGFLHLTPIASNPKEYGTDRVIYLGTDNHIYQLVFTWKQHNLTQSFSAPLAVGKPEGIYYAGFDWVVYCGVDRHIHILDLVSSTHIDLQVEQGGHKWLDMQPWMSLLLLTNSSS